MTRALMQSTQVSVTLALNIITQDNTRRQVSIMPLVTLTPILFIFWQLCAWLTAAGAGLSALVGDLAGAVTVTGKMLAIGVNALAFGVGV